MGAMMTTGSVNAQPGQTVHQVVEAISEQLNRDFTFDHTLYLTEVVPGMIVEVYELFTVRSYANLEIPYETHYIPTEKLPLNYQFIIIQGESGTLFVIDEMEILVGVEISRVRVYEEVTAEPSDMYIAVGTGPLNLPVPENPISILRELLPYINGSHTQTAAIENQHIDILYGLYQVGGSRIIMPQNNEITINPMHVSNEDFILPIFFPGDEPHSFAVEDNFIYVNGMAFEFNRQINMSATAYTADFANTGKRPGDRYFGITASGLTAQVGVVAVDRSVIPFFTLMYIEGYGFAIAGDTGSAVRGNVIDLYFETSAEVRQHGRQRRNVYILTNQDFEIAIRR
jgi:3D (Asp-Asp-Asp) domain-containing protein